MLRTMKSLNGFWFINKLILYLIISLFKYHILETRKDVLPKSSRIGLKPLLLVDHFSWLNSSKNSYDFNTFASLPKVYLCICLIKLKFVGKNISAYPRSTKYVLKSFFSALDSPLKETIGAYFPGTLLINRSKSLTIKWALGTFLDNLFSNWRKYVGRNNWLSSTFGW